MGCYDTVSGDCPACGAKITFQSKAGDCNLTEWHISAAPAVIANDIKDCEQECNAWSSCVVQ